MSTPFWIGSNNYINIYYYLSHLSASYFDIIYCLLFFRLVVIITLTHIISYLTCDRHTLILFTVNAGAQIVSKSSPLSPSHFGYNSFVEHQLFLSQLVCK